MTVGLLVAALVTPDSVALASRALTAVVGLFVAGLAYRGYRRNDAAMMGWLAAGIGLLTAGVFLAVSIVEAVRGDTGLILLSRGFVTVAGLCAVLYALLTD